MGVTVLGFLAVGMVFGALLGTSSMRSGKARKNWKDAVVAMQKAREVKWSELRRVVMIFAVIGFFLLLIFWGSVNLGAA